MTAVLQRRIGLGHRADEVAGEADQADLAATLQSLGAQDRLHLVETAFDIVVYQHLVIPVPVADLVSRARHARRDPLVALSIPRAQPAFALVDRTSVV